MPGRDREADVVERRLLAGVAEADVLEVNRLGQPGQRPRARRVDHLGLFVQELLDPLDPSAGGDQSWCYFLADIVRIFTHVVGQGHEGHQRANRQAAVEGDEGTEPDHQNGHELDPEAGARSHQHAQEVRAGGDLEQIGELALQPGQHRPLQTKDPDDRLGLYVLLDRTGQGRLLALEPEESAGGTGGEKSTAEHGQGQSHQRRKRELPLQDE